MYEICEMLIKVECVTLQKVKLIVMQLAIAIHRFVLCCVVLYCTPPFQPIPIPSSQKFAISMPSKLMQRLFQPCFTFWHMHVTIL